MRKFFCITGIALAISACSSSERNPTFCKSESLISVSDDKTKTSGLSVANIQDEIFDLAEKEPRIDFKGEILKNAVISMGFKGLSFDKLKPFLSKTETKLDTYSLDPYDRFGVLQIVSHFYAQNGDYPETLRLGREMEAIVWENSEEERFGNSTVSESSDQALSSVFYTYISAGAFDRANQLRVKMIAAGLEEVPTTDNITFQKAAFHFDNGNYSQARAYFRKVVEESEDPILINASYQLIISTNQHLNEPLRDSIEKSIKYTATTDIGRADNWRMLLYSGVFLNDLGLKDHAAEAIKSAETEARKNNTDLFRALIEISEYYNALERFDLSLPLIEEAHELVINQEQPMRGYVGESSLTAIATLLAQAKDFDGARSILQSIKHPINRITITLGIAERSIADSEFLRACETFRSMSLAELDDETKWANEDAGYLELRPILDKVVSAMTEYTIAAAQSERLDMAGNLIPAALTFARKQQDSIAMASSLGIVAADTARLDEIQTSIGE